MALPNGFKIVKVQVEDRDRVAVFVRKHFYRWEPMNIALGITEGHRCNHDIYPLKFLHLGLSVMAVTTTDEGQEQIVGVCLNGEDLPDVVFKPTFSDECEKFKKFRVCVTIARNDADIFKGSTAKKAFDIYTLAVDPEFKRNGIGKALVEQSVAVAKENGYKLATVMCSSFFTAKIAEALNMKCVYTLRYDDYLDENGVPVFTPPKPHEEIRVFTIEL